MSTTGIDNWAVNLKDVGAIYPFQGSEGALVVVGLVAWVAWHIWCVRWERNKHQDEIAKYGDQENLKQTLDMD
jgi:hypothetical protein